MSRSNLALVQEFDRYSSQVALIWKDNSYTYQHLLDRIGYWRNHVTIQPGTVVGIEGDFSPEAIALLFVLIELNAIVVPLDINHKNKNAGKYSIAQVQLLITLHAENDIVFTELQNSPAENELYITIRDRAVPGLVLFTSGSSGQPKAALHDFSKLLAKFQAKRKSLRTINFLLFDHWGGLNTLFHILSNGGTVIILDNRTPDHVCELIEKHQVELLPTSPTFLNMLLLSRAYERFSIDSLVIISYGAEPMPESLLKHLNEIFPDIKLQQTYGLIELGVMRSKSETNGSLWVKIGGEGYDVRVVDGLLQIKSELAMLGYLNAPSPFTEDGWFMTGDAVEVNGEYFKILGRKSELINVGGEKVFPQEVENCIMEIEGIKDVVVFGEKNALAGNIVCARIVTDETIAATDAVKIVRTHCRKKLASFKVPVKVSVENDKDGFLSARFKKERVKWQ